MNFFGKREPNAKPVVLVTGCTGYLGAWVAKTAVDTGRYRVRGTTRNVNGKRAQALKAKLPDLELVACELLSDDGWEKAFEGVTMLLHTASPFNSDPKFDYVKPALEGTERVLKFAKQAGVTNVVVTSSCLCIAGGNLDLGMNVGGETWGKMEKNKISYHNSKMLAERYVWAWEKENKNITVNTVLPGFIVGPGFLGTAGGSLDYWKEFTSGDYGLEMWFLWVDVRDAAELHIACLEAQESKRRVASQVIPFLDVMPIVAEEFNPMGYTVPTKPLPGCLFCCLSTCCCCCNPFEFAMPYMHEWDLNNKEERGMLKAGKWRDIPQACIEMMHGFIQNGDMPRLEGYKEPKE